MPDIHRHVAASQRLTFDDLDWATARRVGLTDSERSTLEFFVDIESQTVFYMLEVAKLDAARQAELMTFLTLWNYEEHFHAVAISRLLRACDGADRGSPMERAVALRGRANLRAWIEDKVQVALAKLAPRPFLALWMAWGASQELLTTRGYEEIAARTANPVLAELCRRIAKQERRHFAYYYQGARERLAESATARRLVRWVFRRWWNPVGSGVKRVADQLGLIRDMFPDARQDAVIGEVDRRLADLPGLEEVRPVAGWLDRTRRRAPELGPATAAVPA